MWREYAAPMNAQTAAQSLIDLGWTEQQIAEKVFCSQSTVNLVRRGKRKPLRPLGEALMALARKEEAKAIRREKRHAQST